MSAPSSIVTFLFTDIEGSSSLWEKHPAVMPDVIRSHDSISRSAVERYGGTVVKMTGDGVFAVFADPRRALPAAVDLQREIAAAGLSSGVPLRVRCGVHVGKATERGGDYFGTDVNRAARIMNAAYGGQVLLSSAVFELVRTRLPPQVTLSDLGEIEIRDSAYAERVFQLNHPELRTEFPTLRDTRGFASNVRSRLPTLHGRSADLVAVSDLIPAHPLVTLVGAGGIGKTRLAEAVASQQLRRFDDGVWWIDLASQRDASQVISAVAGVLGLGDFGTADARVQLLARLKRRRALIVLDNCEHLLDDVADIVDAAIAAAPGVRWLATSQQPLKIAGEQTYRLGPLAVPPNGTPASQAMEFGAVALLAQHASAADRRFAVTDANVDAVIDLCAQLDGIPLAIAMAATRAPSLGIDKVRELLHERLRFLALGHRTQLSRHQTLHAALDWSHSLLQPDEQAVFRRLGVFSGGFTLELAQQIARDGAEYATQSELDEWRVLDALGAMVEKSLVQVNGHPQSGAQRYGLLETTRLYALERLHAANEHDEALDRHAHVMAEFIERAFDRHWVTADAPWLAQVEPEIDNLRSALGVATAHADADTAAAIVGSVWPLFRLIDRQYEGRAWMGSAEHLIRQASERRAARALAAIPYVYGPWGGQRAIQASREAVRRFRAINAPQELYLALNGLAWAGTISGQPDSDDDREACAALLELTGLEGPDLPARCRCWSAVVRSQRLRSQREAQVKLLTEMHDLALSIGATERALTAEVNLLYPLLELGRIDEMVARSRNLLGSGQLHGERLGNVLLDLAEALVRRGETAESRQFAREGLRVLTRCNSAHVAFAALFEIAAIERRYEDAARLAGYAEALLAASGTEHPTAVARGIADRLDELDSRIGRAERHQLMQEGAKMTEAQAEAIAFVLPVKVNAGAKDGSRC